MAKKKTSGKLAVGTRIKAKSGVTAPEFPDVPCAEYRQQCEESNLFYRMACFVRSEIDPCEE